MSNELQTTRGLIVPVSRVAINVRPATLSDIPFFDRMQKQFGRQLGYFPTKQFEGYVAMGAVLIAEEKRSTDCADFTDLNSNSSVKSVKSVDALPLGYVISRDRYLKRDELGVVYQLCVAPGTQRKLVGASLIQEVFARSAYGCKLYCCWCAQDIDANYFWESLGFVPVAFRAGSAKKKRVHIFWQRRINDGDVITPYWYPSNTTGGALAEDRLVFPIPPGVRWQDVEAIVLPGSAEAKAVEKVKRLPSPKSKATAEPVVPRGVIHSGGLRWGPVASAESTAIEKSPFDKAQGGKPLRKAKVKVKSDPALVAKARELRDRWLEQLNSGTPILSHEKYDISRMLGVGEGTRALPQVSASELPANRAALEAA